MRLCLAPLAALAASALLPVPAQADETYLSFSGLHLIVREAKVGFETLPRPTAVTGAQEFERGLGFSVALGHGGKTGLRGELEFIYREANLGKVRGLRVLEPRGEVNLGNPAVDVGGNIRGYSMMANVFYAFDTGPVRAYVGAGAGLTFYRLRTKNSFADLPPSVCGLPEGATTACSASFTAEKGNDQVVSWQGMLGVLVPVSDNAALRTGYRYSDNEELDLPGYDVKGTGIHNLEFGFLFRF